MYEIKSINRADGIIKFKYLDNEFDYEVCFSGKDIYSLVNPQCHYICTESDDIININDNVSVRRIFNIDIDSTLYRKATQYDFDKWMNKNYPTSENAHVFKIIFDKINSFLAEQDSSDDDDDEDPYFRGNINDFVASLKIKK